MWTQDRIRAWFVWPARAEQAGRLPERRGRTCWHSPLRVATCVYNIAFTLVCLSFLPDVVVGQDGVRILPPRSHIPQLYADPREPTITGQVLFVTDGPSSFEEGAESHVGLGATVPVLRLAGNSSQHAVVIGVQMGVFARFVLRLNDRDLISTDWVFAAPLVWHRGRSWIRMRYLHWSAHLGDEYIERFEVERLDFARDSGELLVYLQVLSWLGVYGGGGYAFNVQLRDGKRFGFQAGAQADGPQVLPGVDLYAALDLRMDQDAAWDPRVNAQAGLRLSTVGQRTARLALDVLTGPTPQGQFVGLHTTFVSLGLYFDL